MRKVVLFLALAFGTCSLHAENQPVTNSPTVTPPRRVTEKFEFKDEDRVVFLGDAWLAGEVKDGYIETMLTSRSAPKKVSFRNLCSSLGPAQSNVTAKVDGLEIEALKGALEAVKPTVVFLAYGTQQAGAGEAGLARFKSDINRLIDTITNASSPYPVRFVLVTPVNHEAIGSPPSDSGVQNAQLELYAKAAGEVAADRGARLVDLFTEMGRRHSRRGAQNWTEDGLNPSPYGYWQIAGVFEQWLNLFPGFERIGIGRNNSVRSGGGGVLLADVTRTENSARFTGTDQFVFRPLEPKRSGQTNGLDGFFIQVYPMPAGNYTLRVDGGVSAVASGAQWMNAVMLRKGPLFERVEALRRAIISKNELCRTSRHGFQESKSPDAKGNPVPEPRVAAEEDQISRLTELKKREYELGPAQPGDEEKLNATGGKVLSEGKP